MGEFVIVNSDIDDMDEADRFERNLFTSLFAPEAGLNAGRVALSVE